MITNKIDIVMRRLPLLLLAICAAFTTNLTAKDITTKKPSKDWLIDGKSFVSKVEQSEDNNVPALIAVICVSAIWNIIMLLLTLQYRSKWKKLKSEQSERTDFEIDILE